MKLDMKNVIFCLISFFLASKSFAQEKIEHAQNYFRNPLNIPIFLAGNFGECRPGHFHSGIDIKTNGAENQKVYAAADGYVSRIKMEKGGFGHAIYITHPNGYTSLYAHLNRFFPALQKRMEKEEYEKESWAIDVSFGPKEFPVKKGEQIAWSGNTGASTAPHLHFEIRDTKTEHPLNPILFGLPIIDKIAPKPTELALYDKNESIYNQTPKFIKLKKQGNIYTTTDTIAINTDKLGIGIDVNDYMNGSNNTLNYYAAQWYLDDAIQGEITLDNIGYEETRYVNAFADYKTKKLKGDCFQLLFQEPGNKLGHIYSDLNTQNGLLVMNDRQSHAIKIELKDALGNATTISFFAKSIGKGEKQDCSKMFHVNAANSFDEPNVKFQLSDKDIYDDVCFHFKANADAASYSDKYQIGEAYIPIHSYFELSIKPNKPVPFAERDKVAMMYSDGKSEDGQAAHFENGWYTASVRSLGTFWLTTDTTPPVIKSLQKENANLSKAKRISFSVKESITSVKTFKAELDGKWICFEPRGQLFFYVFDEHCPKGKHKLVITASDENKNTSTLVYHFTR